METDQDVGSDQRVLLTDGSGAMVDDTQESEETSVDDDEGPERTKFGAAIPADLLREFKTWVQDKHGQTYGVTGYEVEEALRKHISEEEQLQSEALEGIEEKLDMQNSKLDMLIQSMQSLSRSVDNLDNDDN